MHTVHAYITVKQALRPELMDFVPENVRHFCYLPRKKHATRPMPHLKFDEELRLRVWNTITKQKQTHQRSTMSDSIPPEVVEQLRRFNEALTVLEDTYQKHFSNSLEENMQNRTKEYMGRLKQLEERKTAPSLNQKAARNFVRNALWEPKPHQQPDVSDSLDEGGASEREGRYEMESGDESISLEEDDVDADQMEEEDEALVNSSTVKSAVKRSPQEANITMAGGTLPKKKRL
uniref:Uncharacterized protein n=1 Tax=Setaria digitata TaxID=48799 RepID=A0A915Q201_9BILA